MTIASEITRLQGAKTDARTSIINKGVSVPANATVDTYHTYIDQINTGGVLMNKLSLKAVNIGGYYAPNIGGFRSWEENGTYYCVVPYARYGSSQSDYLWYGLLGAKKVSGSDMQYFSGLSSRQSENVHSEPVNTFFYRKAGAVRIFFSEITSYTSNDIFWWQEDWDLTNNNITITNITRNTDKNNLPPEADHTGYIEILSSSRVDSANAERIDDDGYIYLTLK